MHVFLFLTARSLSLFPSRTHARMCVPSKEPYLKRITLLAVKIKIWLFIRHNRFSFWDSNCATGIGLLKVFFPIFFVLLNTGV